MFPRWYAFGRYFSLLLSVVSAFAVPAHLVRVPGIRNAAPAAPGLVRTAAADLNHDGKSELIVADLAQGWISVSIGLGSGELSNPVRVARLPGLASILAADFDGDGNADLAASGDELLILRGDGQGGFKKAVQERLPAARGLPPIAADFNDDGRPDLAIASYAEGTVQLLLWDAVDGEFRAAPNPIVAGTHIYRLAAGDFDGDGHGDLALAEEGAISLWRGRGDGTFTPSDTGKVRLPGLAAALAAGDFNGDGSLDLTVLGKDMRLLAGDGRGGFTLGAAITTGEKLPQTIVAGDLDADGKADLAVTFSGSGAVGVLTGGLMEPAFYAMDEAAGWISPGDFDGDGRPDLAVTTSGGIGILLGRMPVIAASPQAIQFRGGLLDSAGALDTQTIEVPALDGPPAVYRITADQPWLTVTPALGSTTMLERITVRANSLALAPGVYRGMVRITAPGYFGAAVEVVLSMRGEAAGLMMAGAAASDPKLAGTPSTITLAVTPSPSTYGSVVTLTATPNPAMGKVTFYDGARVLGVAAANLSAAVLQTPMLPTGVRSLRAHYRGPTTIAPSDSAVVLHTVTAAASLGLKKPVNIPVPVGELITADFNGDGRADVATLNSASGTVSVLLGNGDGSYGASTAYSSATVSSSMVAADFNGDGVLDIAVAAYNGICLLAGNGNGTFGSPVTAAPISGSLSSIVAADFDNDGRADLAVIAGNNSVNVLLGNDNGTFQTPVKYTGSSLYSLAAEDFNADGKPDLAIGTYGLVSVMLGNGDGTFQPGQSSTLSSSALAYTLGVADFNGDGKPDLAVAHSTTQYNLTVLLGTGTGTFQQGLTVSTEGYIRRVAIGDLNGDGKPDLVVTYDYGTVADVFQGNGNGTFQRTGRYSLNKQLNSLAIGEVNGDGAADVLITYSDSPGGLLLLAGGAIPDLNITATNTSPFTRGQTGATYKLEVSNIGDVSSSGSVGVSDSLPSGLTATDISGNGWTCVLGTLTCTRSDSLAAGASFPPIYITLNIATNAANTVTNTATVSGGGDANTANNTASTTTTIHQTSATSVTSSPNPSYLGQAVMLTANVTAGATGKVTFYDGSDPIGVAPVSGSTAVITTSMLPFGTRSIRALYNGDATYGPSSASVNHTVTAKASSGFRSTTKFNVASGWSYMVAADFNGDGKPDLAGSGNGLKVVLGRGDGTLGTAVEYPLAEGSSGPIMVADFDLDGKQDLAAFRGNNILYVLKGNGDGTFQTPVKYTPSLPNTSIYRCVVGDFNTDGKPDLALEGANVVSILLGNGDGTFQSPVNSSGTFGGGGLAVGDFNRDGKPDLVVTGSGNSNSTAIAVMLGRGDGSFQPSVLYTSTYGYSQALSIAVADMNGDGKLDIVTSYYWNVEVYLGKGDGTFQAPIIRSVSSGGARVIVADFNGDGKPDIATSGYYYGGGIYILLGNGDGTLGTPAFFPTDSYALELAVADFDGDGTTDLAVANPSYTLSILCGGAPAGLSITKTHTGVVNPGQTGLVYIIVVKNQGFTMPSGMVTVKDTLPAGLTATSLSGYGWTCVLATLQCTRSDALSTGVSYDAILLTTNVAFGLPPSTLNNVASVTTSAGTNSVTDPTVLKLTSATTLTASPTAAALGQNVVLTATTGATGKVSFYDGVTLLGAAAISGTQASLTTNLLPAGSHPIQAIYDGDSTHTGSRSAKVTVTVTAAPASGVNGLTNYATGAGPLAIASSDFNRDGKPDLAVVNNDAASVSVLLGKGDGTFQSKVDYTVGTKPVSVAAGDFNGDGYPDLAVANQTDNSVSILIGTGTGAFQSAVNYTGVPNPSQLQVGDFNSDGQPDIAVGSTSSGIYILAGRGDGTFLATNAASYYGYSIATGDFNGDGKTDLITVASGYGYVLLGDGSGYFGSSYYVSFPGYGTLVSLAVADLNGDGKADLVYGSSNTVSARLGNGDGSFQNYTSYTAGTNVAKVAVADLNGDGKLDILAANSGSNNISVLLGNGDGTFQAQSTYTAGSEPRDLVAGDFNGDHKTDLAIANRGSNAVSVLLGVLPPVLTLKVSHTGTFTAGQGGASYSIVVANGGPGATSGTITVVDTLPVGLTATAIQGSGWNCVLGTLTCTRSDSLATGITYPAITVTVNIAADAAAQVINQATVSGGGSAPVTASDTTAIVVPVLAAMIDPAPGATMTGSSVSFNWDAGSLVFEYHLQVGTSAAGNKDLCSQNTGTGRSFTCSGLPTDGQTIYVRLWSRAGSTWLYRDYTYTASGGTPAAITSPTPGTTLETPSVTFSWDAGRAAAQYHFDVGTTGVGSRDLYSQNAGTGRSAALYNLPMNGGTLYVRLWSLIGGNWLYRDYTFTAPGVSKATMTSPVPGTVFTDTVAVFSWNGPSEAQFHLYVGTTGVGSNNLFSLNTGTGRSQLVTTLPWNAETIYVRLWTMIGGTWAYNDYTYTATGTTAAKASMISPTPGTTLTSTSAAFSWSEGTGTQYHLSVGTNPVDRNDLFSANTGGYRSTTVNNLPSNGGPVYVRLWTLINGTWLNNDYTYTAVLSKASMTSPTAGSVLSGPSVTFAWDAGGGVQYHLAVGTAGAGSANLFSFNTGTARSQVVGNLPVNGSTIYVRLWTLTPSMIWDYVDYTYTAAIGSASMVNPAPGSVLVGSTVTFTWSGGAGAQYHLYIGSGGVGSNNLFSQNTGTATAQVVGGLPTSGDTIYVRLWTLLGSNWQYTDYTYTAAGSGTAVMTSPTPGSRLPGPSVTFTWSAGSATQYHLSVGTTGAGSNNLFSLNTGTVRSQLVTNLPTNSSAVYVRLWSLVGGNWLYNDYTYTASQ